MYISETEYWINAKFKVQVLAYISYQSCTAASAKWNILTDLNIDCFAKYSLCLYSALRIR